MREALLYKVGDLRIVETPKPKINPDEILIAVRCCGVCPTDVRKYKTGNHGVPSLPFNMGHEWTGDVVEVGDRVRNFRVGMRVAVSTWGGYADYVKVGPEEMEEGIRAIDSVLELPETVSYEEGTFVEPLADCIHSVVNKAQVKAGDTVVIVGAGQMGLQHVMIAKVIGARIIVTDLLEDRLAFAKRFGADSVVSADSEDAVDRIRQLTDGRGADAVIVAAGAPKAAESAMKMVKKTGKVVLFAGFEEHSRISFDPNIIHYGEVVLTGAYWVGVLPHADIGLYSRALQFIAEGKIPVGGLVTHRFPLEEVVQALEVVANKEGLKAIINIQ